MSSTRFGRRLRQVAAATLLPFLTACEWDMGFGTGSCFMDTCSSGGGGGGAPLVSEKRLEVTTVTTGSKIDPDGYRLAITREGAGWVWGIAVNTTWEFGFGGGGGGAHTVTLSAVEANCTVAGDNPRTVEIPVGGKASTTFEVNCE
jgi:hypothetical protein